MVKSEQLPAGTRLCHRDSGEWALESEATGTVLFSGSTMDLTDQFGNPPEEVPE